MHDTDQEFTHYSSSKPIEKKNGGHRRKVQMLVFIGRGPSYPVLLQFIQSLSAPDGSCFRLVSPLRRSVTSAYCFSGRVERG